MTVLFFVLILLYVCFMLSFGWNTGRIASSLTFFLLLFLITIYSPAIQEGSEA